jgi:addiction module HigA family antidote
VEKLFRRAVHPGEILRGELEELGLSQAAFARQVRVPPNRISQIVAGKRAISGDTALRLGHWFGMEPQFWMNLQAQFDLAVADKRIGATVRELPTSSDARQGGAQR